jgi:hypothetical protein
VGFLEVKLFHKNTLPKPGEGCLQEREIFIENSAHQLFDET